MVTTQLKSNVKRKDWTGRTGLRDGPGGRSWLLDTGSSMLRRRDCGLSIDRRHPATLNLIHKAPVLIVTGCQSVIIECGGCGVFFQAIGHPPRRDMPGIQGLEEPDGASWVILTLCECSGWQRQASVPQNSNPARACLRWERPCARAGFCRRRHVTKRR